jgi:N-acetylmuramic acid 6-phosphate etherase
VFVRLGYVFGNLMVNVQPKNVKLVDRARRIIAQAVPVSEERAAQLLDASGNQVRAAILMGRTGVDRSEAERRLTEAGGRISQALAGAREA